MKGLILLAILLATVGLGLALFAGGKLSNDRDWNPREFFIFGGLSATFLLASHLLTWHICYHTFAQ